MKNETKQDNPGEKAIPFGKGDPPPPTGEDHEQMSLPAAEKRLEALHGHPAR